MPNLLVPNINEWPISSAFSPPFGLWVDTDPSYMHAQPNTLEKKNYRLNQTLCVHKVPILHEYLQKKAHKYSPKGYLIVHE